MQKSTKSIYLFVNFVRVHYEEVLPKKNKRNFAFELKNDLSIIVLDRKEKMETGIEKLLNNYREGERVFNYGLEILIITLIIFNLIIPYI